MQQGYKASSQETQSKRRASMATSSSTSANSCQWTVVAKASESALANDPEPWLDG